MNYCLKQLAPVDPYMPNTLVFQSDKKKITAPVCLGWRTFTNRQTQFMILLI